MPMPIEAQDASSLDAPVSTVTQRQLNAWRTIIETARGNTFVLRQLLARRQDSAALALMDAMNEHALLLGLDMEHAGAAPPGSVPPRFVAEPGMEDTPACQQLLASLRGTRAAAQAVDTERYGEDGPYCLWLDRLVVELEAGARKPEPQLNVNPIRQESERRTSIVESRNPKSEA